jgi:rare lipoprotein A
MLKRLFLFCCFWVLLLASPALAQEGLTSYYGPGLYGNLTASGEPLDYNDWTAAHPTYAFGTKVKVCYAGTCARGVTITDRGPYVGGRVLDVNMIVAQRIGLTGPGVAHTSFYVTGYDPNYLANVS